MVRGSASFAARARARSPALRGRKPSKHNRSTGSPPSASAVRAAAGARGAGSGNAAVLFHESIVPWCAVRGPIRTMARVTSDLQSDNAAELPDWPDAGTGGLGDAPPLEDDGAAEYAGTGGFEEV